MYLIIFMCGIRTALYHNQIFLFNHVKNGNRKKAIKEKENASKSRGDGKSRANPTSKYRLFLEWRTN